jgi:fructose/tagatose bisphosphate aldolase
MARSRKVPVEAELGAVLGHEEGPLPPYEELFRSGMGFTDPEEAKRFVQETEVDWLSVAVGNIHGAVSEAARDQKKVEARLNIQRVRLLNRTVKRPLVLHGGSGIKKPYLLDAFKNGVSKLNIGTVIRQTYERDAGESEQKGQDSVYRAVLRIVREELEIEGSAERLTGA